MADLQPESMNRPSAVEQSQTLIVAKTNNHLTGHKTTKLQRSTQNQVFWVLRALFGVVGAILYTALYIVIIFVYVRRRGDNNVIDSPYPVNAKIVSGLWFVFSVFILDLSRIGLSACEAAGLTLISFAPSTAVKLLWHADKSWCTVTGLLSVITTAVTLLWQRLKDDRIRPSRSFPGRLWWILLFIHAPLWIAAPLSGLTFSLGTISTLTANDFSVIGVNESTFDLRGWTTVMDVAVIRWSQNLQTTPKAPNIFYAPAGSQHVSQTFYNDRISTFQDGDSISFFAAPEADSLLNGTAWGLKGNISCRLVNPLKDLQLLTVRDLGDFSNTTSGPVGYKESFDIYGASSAILAASNSSSEQFRSKGEDGYSYPSSVKGTDGQPVHDSQLEIVMWQYYNTSDVEDPTMKKMRNRDVVVASPLPEPSANPDILAFGLSFQIQSSVGYAEISARQRTYSNFRWFGSSPVLRNETYGLDPDCPGCLSDEVHCDDLKQLQCQNQEQKNQQMMQTISARHIIMLENLILAALTCEKMGGSMVPQTCFNAWYMANVATGGKLYAHRYDSELQAPALSPERMRLAVLKLAGELAAAMMGPGVEPFKGDLSGVQTIRALKPGVINWKPILALLCLWTLAVTISTAFFLFRGCDAPLLDGYQLFKVGAEWGEEVKGAAQDNFQFCEVLQAVPKREDFENSFKGRPFGIIGETLRRRERGLKHREC